VPFSVLEYRTRDEVQKLSNPLGLHLVWCRGVPYRILNAKYVATLMCLHVAYVAGAHRECDEAEGGWPRT
jgi:hypothetical protein